MVRFVRSQCRRVMVRVGPVRVAGSVRVRLSEGRTVKTSSEPWSTRHLLPPSPNTWPAEVNLPPRTSGRRVRNYRVEPMTKREAAPTMPLASSSFLKELFTNVCSMDMPALPCLCACHTAALFLLITSTGVLSKLTRDAGANGDPLDTRTSDVEWRMVWRQLVGRSSLSNEHRNEDATRTQRRATILKDSGDSDMLPGVTA